jgi:hypothetical protein
LQARAMNTLGKLGITLPLILLVESGKPQ